MEENRRIRFVWEYRPVEIFRKAHGVLPAETDIDAFFRPFGGDFKLQFFKTPTAQQGCERGLSTCSFVKSF